MKLNFEKNKRKLSLPEKLYYHKISIILFGIPFIYLINELLNKKLNTAIETAHKASFFLIFLAFIIIWKRNYALKLKTFQTRLNKNELNNEIEKIANEFNWKTISSSENQYEFKINISSYRSYNLISFGREYKRYIDAIIITHNENFQLNLILNFDNLELIESLGEIKQWRNTIINRLK